MPGPWHAVDLAELRRRVSRLERSVLAEARGRADDAAQSPVLAGAGYLVAQGWTLADRYGSTRAIRLT